MGKGSGANKEALKLQRQSMEQSNLQSQQMLALLQAQVDNARTMKLPKQAAPMPLPGTSTTDLIAQSQETRKNYQKRSGMAATHIVAPPMRSAFGIPILSAAA